MPTATPAASLLARLDAELARHPPFAQMAAEPRRRFIEAAEQLYYAPGETVLEPAGGPVHHLQVVRSGRLEGTPRDGAAEPFTIEPGELFPVGAALRERAVTATYRALEDSFCLRVPMRMVREIAASSAPLADFLDRRMLQLLELAQQALHRRAMAQVLGAQPLDAPLARFVGAPPLAVAPATPLGQALRSMHERRVGSVLVVDDAGRALGILTRHDVLGRVVLDGRALETPIADVMSRPVQTLDVGARAHDAALLMSRASLRHVPITHGGRVVGIVSERDLFALQRLSLVQLGAAIDGAADVAALQGAAADIRRYVHQLLAQGVQARALTELISHLNDRLTARLVALLAVEHGRDLGRGCWLAFGSEGRGEQTIATDQDNGLVLAGGEDVERWRRFGAAVNDALAACGFPLCKGGVMAGQPACCLPFTGWQQRFEHWIEHGSPEDLLAASIHFDLRPIAGAQALAAPLQQHAVERAAATPRFLKQMADNALLHRPPLAWYGGIAGSAVDLKMQGTAIYVEAARLLALRCGVTATGTRARLEAVAAPLGVPATELASWVAGFEYLQLLRLVLQAGSDSGDGSGGAPNRCEPERLNEIDRRVLREALRMARRLQQRIELDYAT